MKVNHSWDEHYRSMRAKLEDDIRALQKQLDDAKNETLRVKKELHEGEDRAKDDILLQAKTRIEKAEVCGY